MVRPLKNTLFFMCVFPKRAYKKCWSWQWSHVSLNSKLFLQIFYFSINHLLKGERSRNDTFFLFAVEPLRNKKNKFINEKNVKNVNQLRSIRGLVFGILLLLFCHPGGCGSLHNKTLLIPSFRPISALLPKDHNKAT